MQIEKKSDRVIKISKPGWKAMPYILGLEAMENLASYVITANLRVYLQKEFHMHRVEALNIFNIWNFAYNFFPIFGAIIADVYIGKFLTIALASFTFLLGMVTIILTASLPQLSSPLCATEQKELGQCISTTQIQKAVILIGLFLMSIGAGGIRPCSIPFGADQFDTNTPQGKKESYNYYNWHYTALVTLVMLIHQTVVFYIQDTVSWALGFSIPAVLMLCAIILFFIGRKFYVCLRPEGSNISSIVQVFIAAVRKRKLKLPAESEGRTRFFDPSLEQNHQVSKLSLSTNLRFLNNAALVEENSNEVKPDGTCANPWKLCSIQQVEEVKHIVKVIPIWASGIICMVAIQQQSTFTKAQVFKMDKHIGTNQIHPGSINFISLITIAIWHPIYDRLLQPAYRKLTKIEEGITILQRIGLGYISSVTFMVVAGLVERKRRELAIHGVEPLSIFWLAPQLIFVGLCEVLVIVGHVELYNREFPERMRSIGTSMVILSNSVGSYLSILIMNIVHHVTRKNGKPDWLTYDMDFGRLDCFYFLIGILCALNFIYFVVCFNGYHYKEV